MNLQALKQNIRVETDMSDIYAKIRRYAEDGESYVTFRHGSIAHDDEISEVQVAILREAGYTADWNRPCLWYEVSRWLE